MFDGILSLLRMGWSPTRLSDPHIYSKVSFLTHNAYGMVPVYCLSTSLKIASSSTDVKSIFWHLKEKAVCILYQYLAPHDDSSLHRSLANLEHWKDAFKDTAGIRVKKKDWKNQGEIIIKKKLKLKTLNSVMTNLEEIITIFREKERQVQALESDAVPWSDAA